MAENLSPDKWQECDELFRQEEPMNEVVKIDEESKTVEPVTMADNVLSIIERAASNPDVDIDKMERLLKMQQEILERDAKQLFNQSFSKAKAEMVPVLRNKRNDQTSSNYADLEIISLAVDPVITENGFSLSFGTDKSELDGHYGVTAELSHNGGFSKIYRADIPSDGVGLKGNANKTKTHAFGSTISYGRRYLKCLIFDIALTDDDGNSAGVGAAITESMLATLQAMIDETESDIQSFCKLLKVPSLAQLPIGKFRKAESLLQHKKTQMGNGNG